VKLYPVDIVVARKVNPLLEVPIEPVILLSGPTVKVERRLTCFPEAICILLFARLATHKRNIKTGVALYPTRTFTNLQLTD